MVSFSAECGDFGYLCSAEPNLVCYDSRYPKCVDCWCQTKTGNLSNQTVRKTTNCVLTKLMASRITISWRWSTVNWLLQRVYQLGCNSFLQTRRFSSQRKIITWHVQFCIYKICKQELLLISICWCLVLENSVYFEAHSVQASSNR